MHPNRNDHQRILLSEAASKHLLEAGECWMIAGKSSEQPGRIVIHMMPLEKGLADKLCEIAMGTRKPGKRINPPAIATDASQGHPEAGKRASC
jgi:hypothetical protein